MSTEAILLKRECDAVRIPSGTPVKLPEETEIVITQSLGGTITVHAAGGLYRIASKDADALGMSPDEFTASAPSEALYEELSEELVWTTLKTCYDPEIPVNIVDLGLIYDMHLDDLPDGDKKVFVKMTLTAPGCGMGSVIAGDAQQKLLALPGVGDASVEIVWDPPWHQSMITSEGKKILGIE